METDARTAHRQTGSAQADSQVEVCPHCNNTGTERMPGNAGRPCRCRAVPRRSRLFDTAGIPQRYLAASLQNYQVQPGNLSQQFAVGYASRLISDYPLVDRGLLLSGPVGTGKTHIAVAILRGLIEKGVPCKFFAVDVLLKQIQETYNPLSRLSELELLQPVFRTEVVVLDELGGKPPTEWVLETLMEIVNARYNDMRLTLFTTNFLDQASTRIEGTLEERIGVKVRSRLYEMCRTLEVTGPDFRKQA